MAVKASINHFLGALPIVGKYFPTFRPGHYYSPIVDKNEIPKSNFNRPTAVSSICLNMYGQLCLLEAINHHRPEFVRYKAGNDMFPYSDAHVLSFMMEHFKPDHVIEIGCGHSSACIIDSKKTVCDLLFVDPEPARFESLIKDHGIVKDKVQRVPLRFFDHMKQNDILFIDSSHVSKTGSDVNHILFNILPRLNRGVIIHFHDIFYPFEYPEYWVKEFYRGFGWNEAYLLKAFLSGNRDYKIIYWDSCMRHFFAERVLYDKEEGGSIWIQKL